MTTTDQHHPATSAEGGAGTVVRLDALKRRKRLGQLLATRSHLAAMAAQQRSHGLDDAEDSFSLQLAVETTIRDEFPEEYNAEFPRWLEADVTGEHPSGVLTAHCGICRSIAAAQGINLVPPDAA